MNIRQTFNTIRQEKLFSTIYIVGTALAITFTMILSIIYYIHLADIYPEKNRSRTAYITSCVSKAVGKDGYQMYGPFSQFDMEDYFYKLKNVEAVSAYEDRDDSWYDDPYKYIPTPNGYKRVISLSTDPNFFRIYPYQFLGGQPFTWDDLHTSQKPFTWDNQHTSQRAAVITDRLAADIFGPEADAVGQEFKLNDQDYRVCGVVKGGSSLLEHSYAEVFIPYKYIQDESWAERNRSSHNGRLKITLMVKDNEQLHALKKELEEIQRIWAVTDEPDFRGNTHTYHFTEKAFFTHTNAAMFRATGSGTQLEVQEQPTEIGHINMKNLRYILFVLLVLLVVPAVNLCGMVSSRMEERMAELGVRKSFGASRGTLFRQILSENLTLTLCGGILGLLLSWIALGTGRVSIFSMFMNPMMVRECPNLTGSMLFSPLIFLAAFLLCCILNLLAALLPAWWNLRKPIVESMMREK